MPLNKIGIFLMVLIFTVGFLLDASAQQTSGNVPLDSFNHTGEISIQSVQVDEKEYYKVVHLNVQIKISNLALEDTAWFEPNSIKLVNENGKRYFPTRNDCPTIREGTIGIATWPSSCYQPATDCGYPGVAFPVYGTQGGIVNYHPCFEVEKEFNKFNVYFGYDRPFHPVLDQWIMVGSIDLSQNQNSIDGAGSYAKNLVTNAGSYAQNLANNASSSAQNLVTNASSYAQNINMTQSKDFFTQFFDWLKNLFHMS